MICVGSEMTGLRMPAKYVDLAYDEMEYTGKGLFDKVVSSLFAIGTITAGVGGIFLGTAICVTTGWTGIGFLGGLLIGSAGAVSVLWGLKSLDEIWGIGILS